MYIFILFDFWGAASGIGKSVCELFAKQGSSVIAAGLQDVHSVAKNLTCLSDDVKHFPCTVDVSSGQDILQMMTDVLKVAEIYKINIWCGCHIHF